MYASYPSSDLCSWKFLYVDRQASNVSRANLYALKPGDKIQIVDMNSKKHSGTFLSVSNSAISFRDKTGEKAIQQQDVSSVKLMKNNHRLRNTPIGTGVGFVSGMGFLSVAFGSKSTASSDAAAVAGLICLVGGAVAGARWPSHKTIYSASSH
ncbi:MAG: hypothetical protein KGM96_15925 [Acidobacteriota bacterium]|nr:hypothetical protein [Acidobacteriota bacterium]